MKSRPFLILSIRNLYIFQESLLYILWTIILDIAIHLHKFCFGIRWTHLCMSVHLSVIVDRNYRDSAVAQHLFRCTICLISLISVGVCLLEWTVLHSHYNVHYQVAHRQKPGNNVDTLDWYFGNQWQPHRRRSVEHPLSKSL